MASQPFWSEDELAALDQHIDQPQWLQRVCAIVSGRSIKAIKVRMAKRRAELGLADGRRVDGGCLDDSDDSWMLDAGAASQALLAAIHRAGVYP